MTTPILFLIFNRPETAARTFAEIARAKPPKLYIAADGARSDRPLEESLCRETREIATNIDWPCEVFTLYRDTNLGCKNAVSSAITWFFEHENEGIILEDDCLPHPSFFVFCEVMLERYRHDPRITHIGGTNFQDGVMRGDGDYYYSHLVHVWGWAGWKRSWKNYDINMSLWPLFRQEKHLEYLIPNANAIRHHNLVFQETYLGNLDTWDYQLFFSNLVHGGRSVIPNYNLISNIGFNAAGTHTNAPNSSLSEISCRPIINFVTPSIFQIQWDADNYTLNKFQPRLLERIKEKLKTVF